MGKILKDVFPAASEAVQNGLGNIGEEAVSEILENIFMICASVCLIVLAAGFIKATFYDR